MDARYDRNMPALSADECGILRSKRVAVVGCGGLGGYVIEILARIGVGAITAIDGDKFDATNLNRQILCEESLLGEKKASAALARVNRINSGVSVTAVCEFFTAENGLKLLDGCDLVVDALDNVKARRELEDSCAKAGLSIVHGAISGWCGQVTVVRPGEGVLSKLYPPHLAELPKGGSPPFAPAVCASIQAAEAVKLLAGRPSSLAGRLLYFDLRTMTFAKIEI